MSPETRVGGEANMLSACPPVIDHKASPSGPGPRGSPMLRTLVVDDHALVRELLMQTMQQLGDGVACSGARNADEAMALLEGGDYDLMLLDLMMPGMNGADILGVLHKRFPALPVVIVSALDDPDTMARAIRHGAASFVSKSSSSDELLDVLRKVLAGVVCLPPQMQAAYRSGRSFADRYGLTPGQMRVLALLAQGKTNRETANRLGICEGTVRIHVSAIFKALKVTNRSQAMLVVNRRKPSMM
jgi:DNA-binding NarL/FixJ family response regulator